MSEFRPHSRTLPPGSNGTMFTSIHENKVSIAAFILSNLLSFMYEPVGFTKKILNNSILYEPPGPGPVSLPVRVHVVVELSEATVPVSRDYVELVRVQSVWVEDLLEEVEPCIGLSF